MDISIIPSIDPVYSSQHWFSIYSWDKYVWVIQISKWIYKNLYIDHLIIHNLYKRQWYWTSVINMLRKNYSLEWEYIITSLWFYEKLWAKISKNKFYFTKLK